MSSELMTSWGEHDSSLEKVLALASKSLCVFDADLSRLKLGRSENIEVLRQFLSADRLNTLRIALQNAEPLKRDNPRMMKLLVDFPQNMTVIECPSQLASLTDSMFIADGRHALIRFHKDHARCKAIIDSEEDCAPYVRRFEEILNEGGDQVSGTTLGL